ncbi:Ubiquitin-conjugating enzyme E2 J1 [Cercospora zeina]
MVQIITLGALFAAGASAQLDIPGLLDGLKPAPADDPRFTDWRAPGANDARSPCPGLNSLANHGFLNRDGRNLTIPHLVEGMAAGLNIGPDFAVAIGGVGLLSSPDVLGGSFDLSDLDQHNFPIEHDASLSRQDDFFGDDHDFNNDIWQQTLSFFDGRTMTSLLDAAEAIAGRTADSHARNPEFVYGLREFVLRYGETGLYLQTMGGNDLDGVTRLDWVQSLFEQERLPFDLGWRPRAEPITLASLGFMLNNLVAVSPSRSEEFSNITADSYKNIFQVIAELFYRPCFHVSRLYTAMSTTGQFSSKNPTIKRILKEASELANAPSSDFHAAPLETDLFEWHFTLRGTSQSPYEGGIYHGRIVLPPAYPLKPPSFRFLTPSGRFEVNREICLSISGHHEETWQPAWGIRTALVAIRSFMDTDAKGQVGGMDASEDARKRWAAQSKKSKCATCGKTNEEIMAEQDEAVKEAGGESKNDVVPDELRLAYREDLNKSEGGPSTDTNGSVAKPDASVPQVAVAAERESAQQSSSTPATATATLPNLPATQPQLAQRPLQDEMPAWIDKAIYGILTVLAFILWQKMVG